MINQIIPVLIWSIAESLPKQSYKTDLDIWDCLGREKLVLYRDDQIR